MWASKECVTCEMRSLRLCCVCVVCFCHLCIQGWVNGTFFFRVQHIILVFVSVGFLSYFYLPKAKFSIGKVAFQASNDVGSMNVWFSAVNDTSTSDQLPQADFVFQSFLTSAKVHLWT